MTEASNRIDYLVSDSAPHHSHIHNDYFRIPSSHEVSLMAAAVRKFWGEAREDVKT